jgi:hypothetical protein
MRFIGEQRLPWRQEFQGTTVGGLSGIDYDAANDEWVMISDDRSQFNPARYYRAKLAYDLQSFKSVQLTGVSSCCSRMDRPIRQGRIQAQATAWCRTWKPSASIRATAASGMAAKAM